MLKAIFFDLDGTLLPMDQNKFLTDYLTRLTTAIAPMGYDPRKFQQAVLAGVSCVIHNDGSQINEAAFWDGYFRHLGTMSSQDQVLLEHFYATDFQNVRHSCGFNPLAAQTVRRLKEMGFRVILATNPLFPAQATHSRVRWAGLEPEDFELVTTFENSCYAKPNLSYYQEILQKQNLQPEECLMVGNDVAEDMTARQLGFQVFLLTDYLINKPNADIGKFPHGSFPELMEYMERL